MIHQDFMMMDRQPNSCDTFVVLPNLTERSDVIFGKNSDRPRHEVQEVVCFNGKKHEPDSTVQVERYLKRRLLYMLCYTIKIYTFGDCNSIFLFFNLFHL